ncbi:MAG: Crp/Fnr family transcriptional regulator [Pyrinomonadaceae bacterium]
MSQTAESIISNHLLRSLPPEDLERMSAFLDHIDLPHGMIINEAEEPITDVIFPNSAVVSVVSSTEAGQSAEAGLIGFEGMTGVEAMLNGPIAINRQIVQLPGEGLRGDIADVKAEFKRGGTFQASALVFTRAMLAQTSQTALCNRLHVADQRLAKWLLMCHDRTTGDTMNITQEFAALMLGTNRVTLTQAAGQLQDDGFIEYRRGVVTITDRKGLEAYSCECYSRIRDEYARYAERTSRPSL